MPASVSITRMCAECAASGIKLGYFYCIRTDCTLGRALRHRARIREHHQNVHRMCAASGSCLSIPTAYTQGAHWDGQQRCLAEPASTSIFCPMPLLWLVPMRQKEPVKSSHWRAIRESLNLDDRSGGHEDLEGLITGGLGKATGGCLRASLFFTAFLCAGSLAVHKFGAGIPLCRAACSA